MDPHHVAMTVIASARMLFLVAVLVAGCGNATAPLEAPKDAQPRAKSEVMPEIPTVVPPKVTLVQGEPVAVKRVTARELGASWRPDCPLDPGRLRLVEVDYRGFDGASHRGGLVVHQDLVDDVRTIFAALFSVGYPIEKMRTPEHYPGAEDELSMEDNNTSAFNCRGIPGSDNWSQHAYGRAIDINPLINPSVSTSGVLEPRTAGKFVDRSRTDRGMLHDGDPVVRLFAEHGWTWGGRWTNPKDYQHFERPSH